MPKQLLFNRNENLWGPSPSAMKALRQFSADHAALYIDGYHTSILAPKLSKMFGIPEDQIIVGYGLEHIIRIIFDSLDPKTDIALTHELHYTYYEKYASFRKVRLEKFNMVEGEKSFAFDVDHCIEKIQQLKPKVVFIISPNNPTGNTIAAKDLVRILAAAGKDTIVVLDEAYFGFDDMHEEKKTLALVKKHDNLMVLRTFSKFYGLAGLRIGFALCGKKIKELLKYQSHYLGASRILEEVAVAALDSQPYYKKVSREIIKERDQLIRDINTLHNFKAYESKSNHIAVRVNKKAKPFLEKKSKNTKAVIFKFTTDGLMRVSIAPKIHTAPFLKVLREVDRAVKG
jgi:histidinol-phosphate aminotransferase